MRVSLAIAIVVALVFPAAAVAQRTETSVKSKAGDSKFVRQSYVRLHDPLPEGSAPHPEACDWIAYTRWRSAKGPKKATKAHSVIALMPGLLGGSNSLDLVARNAVRAAAARKRNIEVWGMDRRSNCLEDLHGVQAADRAKSIQPAFDYYYGGKEVEGRRFAGFKSADEARFLEDFGLEGTVRDWHTVLTREIPSREQRVKRLICGGHSLGGPITAAFASWDFDGNEETTEDAGYNQCSGFVGFDTTVELDGSGGGAAGGGAATGLASQSGASPVINAPPITPGTIQLTTIAGVGAYHQPDVETTFNKQVPNTPEYEVTLRALYSRDAVHFATGSPSARDYRVTGATLFGSVFDDNSAGLSFLRASLGFITGGPLVDKNFPTPNPTLALSASTEPLYTWQDYTEVGRNGAPIALNSQGRPYTSRDSEITSMREMARTFFDGPTNFVEQYFPVRLLTDVFAAEGGDRSGSLSGIKHNGAAMRPILLIQAGDSNDNDGPDSGPARVTSTKPNDKPLSREIVIPGYNHLDVTMAAREQTDGHTEMASSRLALFAMKVVPGRR